VDAVDADPTRPAWRGVIHRWAFVAFVPLFALLVVVATGAGDTTACVLYAAGVLGMLGVSAAYHSGRFGPVATRRLKRLDHSTILLAIGGSYVAVATVGLDGAPAHHLLTAMAVAAPLGIAIRMVWVDAPYPMVAAVYLVVGWLAVIETPALLDALTGVEVALIVGGGLLYTAGGVVYAMHKPDPWPATFGYHEVFHALVVGGVVLHYFAVLSLAA